MNQPGWQKVADLLSVVLRAARWEDEDDGLSTVDRLMEVERKVCHLGDRLGGLGLMGSGTADTVVAGGEMPVRAVMVERGISTESAEGAEGDVNGLQRLGEEMSALREQVVMQQVLLDDGMEVAVVQVWQMFLRKEGDRQTATGPGASDTGQLLRRVEGCEANFHVSMVRFQARLTAMELQMQALEQRDAETGQANGAGRHGEIIGGGRERGRR
jgi:hypothetical protein